MRGDHRRERRPWDGSGARGHVQVEPQRLDPAGTGRAGGTPEVVVDPEHDHTIERRLDQLGELAAGESSDDVRVTDIEARPAASESSEQTSSWTPSGLSTTRSGSPGYAGAGSGSRSGSRARRRAAQPGAASGARRRAARARADRATPNLRAGADDHLGAVERRVAERPVELEIVFRRPREQVLRGVQDQPQRGQPERLPQRGRVNPHQPRAEQAPPGRASTAGRSRTQPPRTTSAAVQPATSPAAR